MSPPAGTVLRPVASPLPLGYLALGCATTLLAGLQLGWLPATDGDVVALALLALVAPAQGVAALVAFAARDVVAATAMGILAGTWASVGLVLLHSAPGATDDGLGLLFLASAAALLVPVLTSLRHNRVPALVLSVTVARLALSGGYELRGGEAWADVAGAAGLVLAVVALGAALHLSLADADTPLEREPGIRERL